MINRISTATKYARLLSDMQMNDYNYNKLTEQLASGKKITSITDDPVNAINVINTNRQLNRIATYEDNVGMATTELDALDDLMALATDYLESAWYKATQANNQTYSGMSLEAIKVEIDETAKTMVDLANSEYNDNYIFAGTNTKQVAYYIDDNGDIVYQGTPMDNPDYIRQMEVADGVFETINTTGDRIFGYYRAAVEPGNGVYTDTNGKRVYETDDGTGTMVYKYENGNLYTGDVADLTDGAEEEAVGAMGALRVLSKSLQMVLDGDTTEGYELMHSTLDMFANAHDQILTEQTKFGGIYNRMEMSASTLGTNSDNLTAYLADIDSVDYAEAITKWMNAQYAYQASLQVTAASMNMSLLNYIS